MIKKRLLSFVLLSLLAITACGTNMPDENFPNVINLENIRSLTEMSTLEKMGIGEIAWMSDGLSIATCKDGREISIINTNTLKEEQIFTSPSDLYQRFSISPKGDRISIIIDEFKQVEIWNIKTQKLVMTLGDEENFDWVHIVSFSPDGNNVATGSWGEEGAIVMLWDLNTGRLIKEIKLNEVKPSYNLAIYNLAFSPDGKGLAAVAYDGSLHIYYDNWSFSTSGDGDKAQGAALAFSPNGDLLAVSGGPFADNLLIYDLSTTWPVVIFDLKEPKGIVRNVSFNADGSIIAAAINGDVMFWEVATGEQLSQLDFKLYVYTAAFSPDGTRLATVGSDLRIWSIPEP